MKILITGGTNGIGKSFISYIGNNPEYQITLICRNIEKGQQLKDNYSSIQKIIILDLSDIDGVKNFIQNDNIYYDILINNAGICPTRKQNNYNNIIVNQTLIVNLIIPYILSKTLLEKNLVNKIINISSVKHWTGKMATLANCSFTDTDYYSNSKFSIMSLGIYFSNLYSDKSFITINPGYVDTGIWHPKAFGESIHKPIRKLLSLRPDDTVYLFEYAIKFNYDNHVYLTPYHELYIFKFIRKISKSIMILSDFFGKAYRSLIPNISDINPDCYSVLEDNRLIYFLNSFL